MKAAVEFKAEARSDAGKGAARATRRAGFTPVNVYAKGKENINLSVETRQLSVEYFRGGFMNKLVSLAVGGKNVFAIPRDIQLNPVTDKIEHADFLAVDEKSVVKVRIPVHVGGAEKSVGLKRGGVLNLVSHNVELLCPVTAIPTSVDVDVTELNIGSSIHLSDVTLPKGVSAASSRDVTIVSISGRSKEEEDVSTTAPAAGAVPASTAKAPEAGAAAGDAKKDAKK